MLMRKIGLLHNFRNSFALPAGIILMLSACGGESEENSPATIDSLVLVGAEDLIRAKLRDPDSAEFGEIRVSRKSGSPIACGTVNSRNGFGGMSGAQRFISNGASLAFLEEEMEGGAMDEVWSRFC